MARQWRHFLLASNTRATTDRVGHIAYCICRIALNLTLSRQFENWRRFSRRVKAKSRKEKLREKRPAYAILTRLCRRPVLEFCKGEFSPLLSDTTSCDCDLQHADVSVKLMWLTEAVTSQLTAIICCCVNNLHRILTAGSYSKSWVYVETRCSIFLLQYAEARRIGTPNHRLVSHRLMACQIW